MKKSSIKVLIKLWCYLSAKRKKQLLALMFLTPLGGLAEAISLGLLIPFISLVMNPAELLTKKFTSWVDIIKNHSKTLMELIDHLNFSSNINNIILFIAGLFILSVFFAGCFRFFLLMANLKVSSSIGADLAKDIFEKKLYQKYSNHVSQNSSDLISNLTVKVSLTTATITAALQLVTSIILTAFLLAALLVVAPKATMIIGPALLLSYLIVIFLGNKKVILNSKILSNSQNQIVKLLQESLGSLRDILLDGKQNYFSLLYSSKDSQHRKAHANISMLSYSPRLIMETIGTIIFAILFIILFQTTGRMASELPGLGALILGMQRLLPVLQTGYSSITTIRSYNDSNLEVICFLEKIPSESLVYPKQKDIKFQKKILFKKVKFQHLGKNAIILNGLSFSILKGSNTGIFGPSGSGKSTCLDLLMGLLRPSSGKILIDGKNLNNYNIRSWQKQIAHVPQNIYLVDGSIAENIAFGTPQDKIDYQKVRESAKQAQVTEFIDDSPEGYTRIVGEGGLRLSAGQRQRIGLARALYKEPKILILDEFTSSLDEKTERATLLSLKKLKDDITIVIVSHKKSTLKICNKIIKFKKYK